jgi:hypothetical protein
MFKFIKQAFSMPKVLNTALTKGTEMLDEAFWTDEEAKQWIIHSAKVLGPQTIARRIIAFAVAGAWVVSTFITAILLLILLFTSVITTEEIELWMEFFTRICLLFAGVMAFYFGTSLARAKKDD